MQKVKAYKNAYKLKQIQKDLIEYEDLYISIEDLSYMYKEIVKEKIYLISKIQSSTVAPCSIEQATKIFYSLNKEEEITYQDFNCKIYLDIQN